MLNIETIDEIMILGLLFLLRKSVSKHTKDDVAQIQLIIKEIKQTYGANCKTASWFSKNEEGMLTNVSLKNSIPNVIIPIPNHNVNTNIVTKPNNIKENILHKITIKDTIM